MSWVDVARKDFEDAVRSKLLWGLAGFLILLVAGIPAIPLLVLDEPGFVQALSFLYTPIATLVPIIGLIVGYQAIVGERESGTMRVLIGLPNRRWEVILGKLLGRSGVVAVPTILAFVIGGIVVVALYDGFDAISFVGLFVLSLITGLVYVAIALGISASVSSRAKAIVGAVSFYVVFEFAWGFVPIALYWIGNRSFPTFDSVPGWYVFVERMSPGQALAAIALDLIDLFGTEEIGVTGPGRIAGEIPFYAQTWFAWVFVILWIVLPVAVGYTLFREASID